MSDTLIFYAVARETDRKARAIFAKRDLAADYAALLNLRRPQASSALWQVMPWELWHDAFTFSGDA